MPVHSYFFFVTCALVLGFVAGLRSMMAPAVLAIALARRPELAPAASPAHWFSLRAVAIVLGILALGELIVDKLPRTPNRTALGPFVVRLLTGAITGAALVQLGAISGWIGAVCGAVGAIIGTFAGFHARRLAVRTAGVRDPIIAVVEDVIALALAATVVASLLG